MTKLSSLAFGPLVALVLGLAAAASSLAEDPFSAHVRPTEPRSPEDEARGFRLPSGFEIQLVAAEPEIQKPLNLAFDARGRLWVTDTVEYPYAAPKDRPARDSIKVLEDADGDGRAEKVTTFAGGLNIPIGVIPYGDGAIAFSIPTIDRFRDRDGDGRAEVRETLFGPFGYERDTHGMNNAFRRGFDGWIYACHGFNNETAVRGADGGELRMQSGNTYRFRPDGSRLESFTRGQVNPFGMALDELGYLYTADCHSSPIYQLLRGGYYPSFGKPDDGLGFVPPIMVHDHGSTAIAGVAVYVADQFPLEYRGNFFVGNVMTSRVNRDVAERHGSSVALREAPDFVRAEDPWFRPVDLQVAPDGTLYVADFYNRIIGHYEVPLAHPGRDRHRGRIWRIVYRGEGARPPRRPADLSQAAAPALVEALAHPSLTARLLATHEIADGAGAEAAPALAAALAGPAAPPEARAHGLWALERLSALTADRLGDALRDPAPIVRVHALRVLAERRDWTALEERAALAALRDADWHAVRAAVEALSLHPSHEAAAGLLELSRRVPDGDAYLRHGTRLALRNQIQRPEILERLRGQTLAPRDAAAIAEAAKAVPSAEAASFLIEHVERHGGERDFVSEALRHAARHGDGAAVAAAARVARQRFAASLDFQVELLKSIRSGLEERGQRPGADLKEWAEDLARRLLESLSADSGGWSHSALSGLKHLGNPWGLQRRASADGDGAGLFISSLAGGERHTGVLRSRIFVIPARWRFFLAGHNGFPDRPAERKNSVRLHLEDGGEAIAEALPPRNDVAQPVVWDLGAWEGRRGYLEIVDGDDGGAYAWLAIGRFEGELVPMPGIDLHRVAARTAAAAEIAAVFRIASLRPELERVLESDGVEPEARSALARALLVLAPDDALAALPPVLGDASMPDALVRQICSAFVHRGADEVRAALAAAVTLASATLQTEMARLLAASPGGAEALFGLIEAGKASPRVLALASVREKVLAARPEDGAARVEKLTAGLPPEDESRGRLLAERLRLFARSSADPARGAESFQRACAPCHRLGGQGALIGPQLDGLGGRGLERLIEDVLDPNRNVDVAFRSSTFVLDDGLVIVGLHRRDEGETAVIAGIDGKEQSIPKRRIARRIQGESSLMPDNFSEALPVEEFTDLLAYLLLRRPEAGK
jgi:putative heme-binding domain-containing protein